MASSSNTKSAKKSKGRFVPSRYKQSAENYSSNCSDETSSGPYKFDVTRNTKFLSSTRNKTKTNLTTVKRFYSTPETDGAARPNFDESAIPGVSCTITTCPKKDRLKQKAINGSGQKVLIAKGSLQKNDSDIPASQSRHLIKTSKSQSDLEAEYDIYYAQYQLNLLLENKARKSLHDKSKVALEKIYEVFCYLQVLMGKHENIKKNLNLVSFLLKLHEHLNKQEKILNPFLEVADQLEKQSEEIAKAVDCVRHKLLIDDVLPPEGSEDEIINLMNNIDNFLNVILTSVGSVDDLVSSADAASTFVERGKLTTDEIKRSLELLAEDRSLVLSESALRFASLCVDDQT